MEELEKLSVSEGVAKDRDGMKEKKKELLTLPATTVNQC
jgi:hypothetical protein